MSRAGIVGLLFLAAIIVFVIGQSLFVEAHSCEICMEYDGRSQCRTVGAATIQQAREGAITNACAFLSSGVTGTIACHDRKPVSERCQ